jgi:hypothetical protein
MILFDKTIFKIKLEYQLSYILIPLVVFLYIYVIKSRNFILYHAICIGIIGTINCYYKYIENTIGIVTSIVSAIIHLSLLLLLVDFKKNGKINMISLILLLIANLTILLLPYWPYSIKRETVLLLYNGIYIFLYFIYVFLYDYSVNQILTFTRKG